MSTDPEMGPQLRDADTPQRFEFPDMDAVVNITSSDGADPGENLHWEWSDDVDWEPVVKMTMDSDVANRYFQGKENVAMAIARAPHQDLRRREEGAEADPDHEARLRAVSGDARGGVSAFGRVSAVGGAR